MGSKRYNKNMHNRDPKEYTRSQLRYIFRRIIKRISEKPRGYFVFKRMRGICGEYCWDESIKIDHRKQLIPTIIHEVLHDLYPKNWEGWVARIELKIVNILTPYDIWKLLSIFFTKVDIGPYKRLKVKRKRIK